MDVKDVKTAKKIGDFVLRNNSRNKIDMKYLSEIDRETLTDDSPRVYLIVQDGVIKKIGGSAQRGGIIGTISFYVGAMTGSPGVPRFVIHLLIAEALTKGSNVEMYMITSPKTLALVSGLFGTKNVEIASYKEMEDFCKSDYYSVEGKYPDWNFQENHEEYPPRLARQHTIYHQNRLRDR